MNWSIPLLLLFSSLALVASNGGRPLIIAHRGTPCRFPEETIHGYQDAIDRGVDYIELDVISTKDEVLIARHEVTLDASTNVGDFSKFINMTTRKRAGGISQRGYFALDFTFDDIAQLRVRQVLPFRDQRWNDKFKIPTVAEVLGLVKQARATGRQVGAYIETKAPHFHHLNNITLEELLMKDLNQSGLLNDPGAVILQSFSFASLLRLNSLLQEAGFTSIPLTWLIRCAYEDLSDEDLEAFAEFGTTLGLDKKMLVETKFDASECHRDEAESCSDVTQNQTCTGRIIRSSNHLPIVHPIVSKARSLNLTIHAYTFRNEERFMALNFMADPLMEIEFYMENNISIDGAFVDCPETFLTPNPILELPETTIETTTLETTQTTTLGTRATSLSSSDDSEGEVVLNESDEGDDDDGDDEADDDSGSSGHGSTAALAISIVLLIVAVAVIGLWVLYKRNSRFFRHGRFVELSNDVERADYTV